MENCLVTEFLAEVNNPNMPILGDIILPVVAMEGTPTANNASFRFQGVGGIKIKVDGSGYFAESFEGLSDPALRLTEKTYTTSNDVTIYLKNDNYNLIINSKYSLIKMNTYAVSSAGVSYMTPIDIDLANIRYMSSLVNLEVNYSPFRVHGDIANLNDCPAITILSFAKDNLVTGNIASIASTHIFSSVTLYQSGITGSIEDLVAGQVEQGVTSPSTPMSARGALDVLTFGGQIRSHDINSMACLTWDGTNKIIFGIGSSSVINNCTTLYVKGATAEEIAVWQAAGKTVIDVS